MGDTFMVTGFTRLLMNGMYTLNRKERVGDHPTYWSKARPGERSKRHPTGKFVIYWCKKHNYWMVGSRSKGWLRKAKVCGGWAHMRPAHTALATDGWLEWSDVNSKPRLS